MKVMVQPNLLALRLFPRTIGLKGRKLFVRGLSDSSLCPTYDIFWQSSSLSRCGPFFRLLLNAVPLGLAIILGLATRYSGFLDDQYINSTLGLATSIVSTKTGR